LFLAESTLTVDLWLDLRVRMWMWVHKNLHASANIALATSIKHWSSFWHLRSWPFDEFLLRVKEFNFLRLHIVDMPFHFHNFLFAFRLRNCLEPLNLLAASIPNHGSSILLWVNVKLADQCLNTWIQRVFGLIWGFVYTLSQTDLRTLFINIA